jgi:hypothetical protein
MSDLLAVLLPNAKATETVADWLTAQQPGLGHATAADWLVAGRDADAVLEQAKRYARLDQ